MGESQAFLGPCSCLLSENFFDQNAFRHDDQLAVAMQNTTSFSSRLSCWRDSQSRGRKLICFSAPGDLMHRRQSLLTIFQCRLICRKPRKLDVSCLSYGPARRLVNMSSLSAEDKINRSRLRSKCHSDQSVPRSHGCKACASKWLQHQHS